MPSSDNAEIPAPRATLLAAVIAAETQAQAAGLDMAAYILSQAISEIRRAPPDERHPRQKPAPRPAYPRRRR